MKYATKISNSHIKTKINQLIPHIFQQKTPECIYRIITIF